MSLRPRIRKDSLFEEYFQYVTAILPAHWTVASGEFSVLDESKLTTISPGEIVYSGTPFNELPIQPVSGNMAIILYFWSRPDSQLEIRARRKNTENYLSLSFDNDAQSIVLSAVQDSTIIPIDTFTHQLTVDNTGREAFCAVDKWTGKYKKNALAFWLYGNNLYGFLNGTLMVSGIDPLELESPSISLTCQIAGQRFDSLFVKETLDQPPPSLLNALYTEYREQLQDYIEPDERTWKTLKRAVLAYDGWLGIKYDEDIWTMLGYPAYEPKSEHWFTEGSEI